MKKNKIKFIDMYIFKWYNTNCVILNKNIFEFVKVREFLSSWILFKKYFNLDLSFYEWLLPRLKRFTELTNSYDDSKNSFENWKKELEENIKKLELIIKYQFDEVNFPVNYPNKSPLNAYIENRQEFMEWFGKNISNLWW